MWVLGNSDRPLEATAPYRAGVKLPEAGWVGQALGSWAPIRGSAHPPGPLESLPQAIRPSEGFSFISPVSVVNGAPEGRRVLLRAERGPAETTPAPSSPWSSPQGSGGVSPCLPPLLAGLPRLSPSLGLSHRHLCYDLWGPGGLSLP